MPSALATARTTAATEQFSARVSVRGSAAKHPLDDKILLEREEARAAGRRRLRWLDLSAVDRIRRHVFPLAVVEALESLAVLTSVVD